MTPSRTSSSTLRYAQLGSPLIHAVPATLGILRPLCGRPPAIDPRDLFDPGSRVWSERADDRCPGCARLHPAPGGEQ